MQHGVVRGSARQAATAASLNQTVRLPRWRRAASYAAQLLTRCRCLGMRWRRAALALNGTAEVRRWVLPHFRCSWSRARAVIRLKKKEVRGRLLACCRFVIGAGHESAKGRHLKALP